MRTRIVIQNLKCGGCAKTILSRINEENDVLNAEVLIDDSSVQLEHDQPETPIRVKSILKTLGYPSVEEENGIMLKARSVVSCASGRIRD